MIKRDLSQGCKDFSVPANQLVWYFTSTNWRIKTYDHLHCHHHQKKSFWQNSTPIYDKTLHKMSTDGTYLNITKAIYNKPTANIILSGEKLKEFPLKSGKIQGWAPLPVLFNIVLEVLATIEKKKEIKKCLNCQQKVLPWCIHVDTWQNQYNIEK